MEFVVSNEYKNTYHEELFVFSDTLAPSEGRILIYMIERTRKILQRNRNVYFDATLRTKDLSSSYSINDFELESINSFKNHFPMYSILCCFFYFKQNIWRKIQALGLTVAYTN
ncbi:hypothetical protein RF11_01656 [Thelohanellus kitauei]|uniref:Uncharacterized protein n=1 Tax=Thelohanellus kitauei TaxID=669202 RepID=A0A0C2MSB9_THEKT|nr:hypothetical protein RF11_01656 [Thelohanellus kitauei]